jgi:hypothetical protein
LIEVLVVAVPRAPVAIHHRGNHHGGHRQKHAGYTIQLGASQHRQDHRQRMQVGALAHQARKNDLVLEQSKNSEKRERPERQDRCM